jgi:AraC-like DNA-binding protein
VLELSANEPDRELTQRVHDDRPARARISSPTGEHGEQDDAAPAERVPPPGSNGHDTASRVRAWLDDEDDLAEASTKWVARGLGLSVRTLSRRLRDEGTSYRAVLEEMRQHSAKRQLARGQRSIAEIAMALGFASSQGFHRAFKRWTGTTAGVYRQNARTR